MKTSITYLACVGACLIQLTVQGSTLAATDLLQKYRMTPQATGEVAPANQYILVIYDSSAQPSERLLAAHSLANDLNRSEIELLYRFLKAHPSEAESNVPGLRYVKNEVFEALRQQLVVPADLVKVSSEIYRDTAQDVVTRDYAVQNLVNCLEEGVGSAAQEKQIYKTLLEVAHDGTSIAGTALVGLDRAVAATAVAENKHINDIAVSVACSATADSAARASAMQVCARRGLAQILPAAEALAHGSPPVPLRMSAIAAIGKLGGASQLALLEQLQQENDPELTAALESAVAALHKRIGRNIVMTQALP